MKLLFALPALLTACDDGFRACADMLCMGDTSVQIQLVDDNEAPVAARGEYRVTGSGGGIPNVVPFGCSGAAADAGTGYDSCSDSVLVLGEWITRA